MGGIVLWRFHALAVSGWIWGAAAALVAVYYAVPPLRRPVYLGWMYVTYPIGWLVTHVILAAVYFLLLTPIGLARRAAGRDPLRLKPDPNATTHWVEHRPDADPERYFRQF